MPPPLLPPLPTPRGARKFCFQNSTICFLLLTALLIPWFRPLHVLPGVVQCPTDQFTFIPIWPILCAAFRDEYLIISLHFLRAFTDSLLLSGESSPWKFRPESLHGTTSPASSPTHTLIQSVLSHSSYTIYNQLMLPPEDPWLPLL